MSVCMHLRYVWWYEGEHSSILASTHPRIRYWTRNSIPKHSFLLPFVLLYFGGLFRFQLFVSAFLFPSPVLSRNPQSKSTIIRNKLASFLTPPLSPPLLPCILPNFKVQAHPSNFQTRRGFPCNVSICFSSQVLSCVVFAAVLLGLLRYDVYYIVEKIPKKIPSRIVWWA